MAGFWTGVFPRIIGVLFAAGTAYVWTLFGGFPHDADRYGRIPVPGKQVVTLPEGRIPLDHDDDMSGGGDTRTLDDAPPGLAVSVKTESGEPLEVESVPSWLFTSSSGDRGHEPFGRVTIERAGRYVVTTSSDERSSSAQIVVGATPWTPFGSVLLGAMLVAVLIYGIAAAVSGLIRFGRGMTKGARAAAP